MSNTLRYQDTKKKSVHVDSSNYNKVLGKALLVVFVIYQATKHFFLPELCFELGESRSLAGVIRPTLGHQTVEGGRALWRHSQSLTVLYPADHIIVLDALERLDAVHQDLPHTHAYKETVVDRNTDVRHRHP